MNRITLEGEPYNEAIHKLQALGPKEEIDSSGVNRLGDRTRQVLTEKFEIGDEDDGPVGSLWRRSTQFYCACSLYKRAVMSQFMMSKEAKILHILLPFLVLILLLPLPLPLPHLSPTFLLLKRFPIPSSYSIADSRVYCKARLRLRGAYSI